MDADNPTDSKDKEEDKPRPASISAKVFSPLEIFSYVLIGLATAANTVMSVSTQFYKNLFEHKVYPEIWEDRDKKYQKLYEAGGTVTDLAAGTRKIEKDFITKLNTELALTGIPPATGPASFVQRTWKQFHALKNHEKTEVVAKLGLIFSIGTGALLFIVNNMRKSKRNVQVAKQPEAKVKNKSEEQNQQPEKTYAGGEIKKTTQDGYVAAVDNARASAANTDRQIS